MSKRFLALLLALVMLAAFLPVGVLAEGQNGSGTEAEETPAPNHTAANHVCEECKDATVEWLPWEKTTELPTSGHYYLTDHVTLSATATVDGALTLCLNGKTITGTRKFNVLTVDSATDVLTITDCTASGEGEDYKAGTITGGYRAIDNTKTAAAAAVINLYDGILTDNVAGANNGGAIALRGTLNMYGGKISNNTTGRAASGSNAAKNTHGGAVYIYSTGAAHITGGQICDNHAFGQGGGIYATEGATLTIDNALFSGNDANDYGGGLYLVGVEDSTITNTVFTENSGKHGGGLYVHSSTLAMENVSLTGNTSNAGGSAIHITNTALVTLKDFTATGNTATDTSGNYMGAVYVAGPTSVFTLRGKILIDNNTAASKEVNLFVQNNNDRSDNAHWIVLDNLDPESRVDISLFSDKRTSAAPQPMKDAAYLNKMVLSLKQGAAADGILSYNSHPITYNETDKFVLTLLQPHTHCPCGQSHTEAVTGHDSLTWEIWDLDGRLPTTTGNYYLINDLAVAGGPNRVEDGQIVNLCLNGKTVNGAGCTGVMYRTNGTSKLTITDCTATFDADGKLLTSGVITGVDENNGPGAVFYCINKSQLTINNVILRENQYENDDDVSGYAGGVIHGRHNASIALNNCLFQNNSSYEGGVLATRGSASIVAADCWFLDNTARGSGAVAYIFDGYDSGADPLINPSLTMIRCTLQNNTAGKNGGAIATADQTKDGTSATTVPVVILDSCVVENNTSRGNGGAVYLCANAQLSLKGDTVLKSNQCSGMEHNLFVSSDALIQEISLMQGAAIGVTAREELPRAISTATSEAMAAFFTSDSSLRTLTFKAEDSKLWVDASAESIHSHCLCAGDLEHCEHTALVDWQAWENATMMPNTPGNYYLVTDVTVSDRILYKTGHIQICLNGHTVTCAADRESGAISQIYSLSEDAKLTITDCSETPGTITGCTQSAVLFQAKSTTAEFNLYNGNLVGNSRVDAGGAVVVQGTGVFNMYGGTISNNTSVAQTSVADSGKNTAVGGIGGGVYVGKGATMNLYGGEISKNTATMAEYTNPDDKGQPVTTQTGGYGGGIHVASGTLNLYGGTVADNQADRAGAGVYLTTSTATLTGGTISGNKTGLYGGGVSSSNSDLTLDGVVITGNHAGKNGGGVFSTGSASKTLLRSGEISKNTSDGPAAGVLIQSNDNSFTMEGGTITGNSTKSDGGGLYVSTNSSFTMTGGTISKNKGSNGGGMYLLNSKVTLSGGKITGNSATKGGGGIYCKGATLTLNGVSVTGNSTDGNGAGLCTSSKAKVTMTGGSVSSNKAKKAGGGMLLQSGSTLNLRGGSISYNTSGGNGGGIYASYTTTVNMSGGTISKNTTNSSGAAIFLLDATGTFSGGRITENYAKKNCGGVYLSGAKGTFKGTNILNNKSDANGGGITTGSGSYTSGGKKHTTYPELSMSAGTISGNTSQNGGGILLQSKTVMTITGGIIENNTAVISGGGIYVSTNANLTMTGGSVRNNQAANGGGIYHLKSVGAYDGLTIEGNVTEKSGGAMVVSGETANVMLTNCTFTNNTSNNGGALVVQSKAMLNLNKCTITKNSCENQGGAIYVSTNSFLNMVGCEVTENTAKTNAGGIYGAALSQLNIDSTTFSNNSGDYGGALLIYNNCKLTNCTINNNKANYGGAIALRPTGATAIGVQPGLRVENTTIFENSATELGGAIYINRGSTQVTLKDSTLTKNTAKSGSGIWADEDLTLYNTIITDNTATDANGYAVYLTPGLYDGQSYFVGLYKISGNTKIWDNEGKNLYVGEGTTVVIGAEGLTGEAKIGLELASGLLTNTLFGAYDYEGGNLVYTVTPGTRSLTEPEYAEPEAADPEATEPDPTESTAPTQDPSEKDPSGPSGGVIAAIAGAAVAVAAGVSAEVVVNKKKKASK